MSACKPGGTVCTNRKVRIGEVANIVGCAKGLAWSIMHDHRQFQKLTLDMFPEN